MRPNGNEVAEAGGDSAKSTKSTEKTPNGKINKIKVPKTVKLESPSNFSSREPDDGNFTTKKKGVKRRRTKDEPADVPTSEALKNGGKHKKRPHSEEESDGEPLKKHAKKKPKTDVKLEEGEQPVSKKSRKTKEEIKEARELKIRQKEEEEQKRWRWWEEEKYEAGVKWRFLEHKGPYFPPDYQPLPDNVHFYYKGDPVKLSLAAEEVAVFFAQMLDHEYTTKKVFRENFFKSWRREMTHKEQLLIQDLDKCDFGEIHAMHKAKVEEKRNLSKEEKLVLKETNQKIVEEFGYCMLDHHRERIGNFKIEPPGLFRGRGEHPKQGKLKKRIQPEDVIINCSRESCIPVPPAGHHWKEVRHDNTVTWLASWTENIQGSIKYVMLNANSKLKGEKDWEKYEVARKLKQHVDGIREQYLTDMKSKEMRIRQRAVALYFIDKLALRAGNEKEEGETADTVGCCSLRVEHITLHKQLDGNQCVVEFDFLGKDSIRYYNKVPVINKAFKNLKIFMENKDPGDELFDRLTTAMLNKHLSSLMPGLTAKVFRTYNASTTLQQQLKELTKDSMVNDAEKLLGYNRANRAVAILCNHQRAPPKTFEQSMANLQAKITARKEQLAHAKRELEQAKKDAKVKGRSDPKLQILVEKKKAAVKRCSESLMKLEVQATDREENKQIALGTSKLNYLDPRISVAWCKRMGVPIEKIYNKTQRDKFAWAIDMTETNFEF
ncbi:DNA topoisomerase I, mitochondrial isoform X1 [Syngnathus acus]|uniref:DNA topoisomerase I, mitochondrial isoform X1 n=1 Tax=Syngnathus acus TaxID=161584 RepID=UPI001885DC2B|nr:DNA topoisomerase I, mitochondrial isoform X1 [Syngnathus acus]XP_037111330.1 DNA topoisomerase I, mitochondrial isoform X1 [Syngnathus acus]